MDPRTTDPDAALASMPTAEIERHMARLGVLVQSCVRTGRTHLIGPLVLQGLRAEAAKAAGQPGLDCVQAAACEVIALEARA